MNKYLIIGLVLVVIVIAGAGFSFFANTGGCEPGMGNTQNVTIVSVKNEWRFDPDVITVDQCDTVNMTIINQDNYDHGVAIDAFGISQRLPANETIEISFQATKAGEFQLYCSVSCGSGLVTTGPYAGEERGHFDHLGRFIINALKALVE